MRIYLCFVIWFASAVALLAQVDSSYNHNHYVQSISNTAQIDRYRQKSPTMGPWALEFALSGGGIIFGKGTTQIFYRDLTESSELEASSLDISIGDSGNLVIHAATPRDGKVAINSYEVGAHFFAVCPMAKHVQRDAPLGFTMPPYIDEDALDEGRLVPYKNGYIAKEFTPESDKRVSELVRKSDFWPARDEIKMSILAKLQTINQLRPFRTFRISWPLNRTIKRGILKDVNSINIFVDNYPLGEGFSYITGDFHLNTAIVLNPSDGSAMFFGFPLTYYQRNIDGRMVVYDVKIMANILEVPLATDYNNFGPTDFKSLYDLSATFAFFRDNAPDKLSSFISRECAVGPKPHVRDMFIDKLRMTNPLTGSSVRF